MVPGWFHGMLAVESEALEGGDPGASSVPEALEADRAPILSATLVIERDELADDGRRSDAAQVGCRLRVGEPLVHRPERASAEAIEAQQRDDVRRGSGR
jgi:hypothetical protein